MTTKQAFSTLIAIVFFVFNSSIVNCQTSKYNYSVKDRWVLKTSASLHKTPSVNDYFTSLGLIDKNGAINLNLNVNANFGINKFIELGVFAGFQTYDYKTYLDITFSEDNDFPSISIGGSEAKSLAPLLGLNLNFHVLPFIIKSENFLFDLYITAKYASCLLINNKIEYPVEIFDQPLSKLRPEYGLGIGAGYYFNNSTGIFVEYLVGQFSVLSNSTIAKTKNFDYNLRVGMNFKL